jgi:hypothetical protein
MALFPNKSKFGYLGSLHYDAIYSHFKTSKECQMRYDDDEKNFSILDVRDDLFALSQKCGKCPY